MKDPTRSTGAPPYVDPAAFVASGATVHAGAWIGPEVHLADGVVVGPGSVLGFASPEGQPAPVHVGEDTWIGPGVSIETGIEIGPGCRIGSGTHIRSGSQLGRGVFLGSHCLLVGNCQIGNEAMLYADVHVCEHAVLEESCQLMPGVVLLNEAYPPTGLNVRGPVIGRCAVVGVGSLIWPGVRLGFHAMVGLLSVVKKDVPEYALVRGCPAEYVCDVREIRAKTEDKWVFPYPWMRHHMQGDDITKRFR